VRNNKLAFILSLFILLALPSISLYYSFQGSKLRKEAMAELLPKGQLADSITQKFTGEFTYRIIGQNCPDNFLLDSLIDQFILEDLQFVLLGDSIFEQSFETNRIAQWNKKGSVVKNKLPVLSVDENWKPCQFKLLDKKHQVLNTYDLQNAAERRKMVEHIALLVTRK